MSDRIRVPHQDTVEGGHGMVRGYCSLWREVFIRVANDAAEDKEIQLKDLKKLALLSSQVTALTDLKKIKEQFASYKDMMADILSRKGKIPKEDLLSMIEEVKARG